MAEERTIKTQKELIEEVKAAGLSIIQNAASIIGDETYFLNTIVSFKIERSKDSVSTVHIHREFIPEANIEGPIQEVKEPVEVKKEVKKNGKQKATNSTTRKTTKRK